ncbi:hypothetical protein BOTBODRAFT_110458 [Botryobasidium botryosum FD-172 SS1]|uniref:sn-1-specific diacylglycerol lipase n=1 Tax=Botryobasidium botryosum (strain FD-172 SS1) TaxID=930990 RepID=A0A067MF72_BOTB1|nr:hypothetical protein BOTBODRAFT_110458 [Botryobasidium botryosum FD-172 SS1]
MEPIANSSPGDDVAEDTTTSTIASVLTPASASDLPSQESSVPNKLRSYSSNGLQAASAASAVGFYAATRGTQFGFSIARGVISTIISTTATIGDHIIYGRNAGTGDLINGMADSALSFVESAALAPIQLGQTITSTSLVAAAFSIDSLTKFFESDETSFSLGAFVKLVRREWNEPVGAEELPEKRYSVTQVLRALITWAAIQAVTREFNEKRWLDAMVEVDVGAAKSRQPEEDADQPRGRKSKGKEVEKDGKDDVHVTSGLVLPDGGGEILTADIGRHSPSPAPPHPDDKDDDEPRSSQQTSHPSSKHRSKPRLPRIFASNDDDNTFIATHRSTLHRLARLIIGGHGGAAFLFFGIPFPSSTTPGSESEPPPPSASDVGGKQSDVERLISDSAKSPERTGSSAAAGTSSTNPSMPAAPSFSWWDLVMGRHDQEIFENFAFTPGADSESQKRRDSATVGKDARAPRFWVLKDHSRKQIVLVMRGTFSLNELAIDLTCEAAPFIPASSSSGLNADRPQQQHYVHGGMLTLAQKMGLPGQSVHTAVRAALAENRKYDLVLCGHSLGGGLAAIFALMWADPETCLTVPSSGLPKGRKVFAFCLASPCVTSPALSRLSTRLITSFIYSHDVVSRLSLCSVRDLNRAAVWLCHANEDPETPELAFRAVLGRAMKLKSGGMFGSGSGEGDTRREVEWFVALRKTLEANMKYADLFPPGRVFWAIRDADLHPSHRRSPPSKNQAPNSDDLRLFRVKDVDVCFGQIEFAKDFLSSHLPPASYRALHDGV